MGISDSVTDIVEPADSESDHGSLPKDQSAKFKKILDRRRDKVIQLVTRFAGGRFLRDCPNCEYHGRFSAFGSPPRFDAQCPSCSSLERHRLLILALDRLNLIAAQDEVLHFAPEQAISALVRARSGRYVTTDFMRGSVDIKLNIEMMDLPDGSFDRILCMHVLEHVNDAKALAEIYRVLRPGGTAILATPVIEGWEQTYEAGDPGTMSKAERVLHYGQYDHVRYYGRDLRARIRKAGFRVEEFTAVEPDVSRYGLQRGETLFIARKAKTTPRKKA